MIPSLIYIMGGDLPANDNKPDDIMLLAKATRVMLAKSRLDWGEV